MDMRGIDTDLGWINRRFTKVEREIEGLRSERRGAATTIGSGGLTIESGGDLRILDASGMVVFSALDGPIRTVSAQNDLNSVNFTTSFADYCVTNITVPQGYTQAIVQLFTSAGVNLSSPGNIYIRPVVGSVVGAALTNGETGGFISISSGLAVKVPVTFGTPLVVKVGVYVDAGAVSGSGNAHLSATVIFTRT